MNPVNIYNRLVCELIQEYFLKEQRKRLEDKLRELGIDINDRNNRV